MQAGAKLSPRPRLTPDSVGPDGPSDKTAEKESGRPRGQAVACTGVCRDAHSASSPGDGLAPADSAADSAADHGRGADGG